MAISVQPGSADIKITARPIVNDPVVNGAQIDYTATPIQATGEVTLLGDAGDSAAGWTVGFVQVQWIETNWCFYRGQSFADGSIFIQRARPPARPTQACCDCVNGSPPSQFFYSTIPAHGEIATAPAGRTFPLKLAVSHFDQPSDNTDIVEDNHVATPGTSKQNFLAESQMEFHFCTMLSVRDPGGNFQHLKCFYWNVHWEATFRVSNFANPGAGLAVHVVRTGTFANVGHLIDGEPVDPRFLGILHTVNTRSCNDLAAQEISGPNRHEARVWTNFDVRRP